MTNNIIKKPQEEIIYVGAFRRGVAVTIDIFITGFLRVTFAQLIGTFWFNQQILNFMMEFKEKFNTTLIGTDPAHMAFLVQHQIIKFTIIFYILIILVGALYYAFFDSSSWCATIGKRIMGVILVKNEGKELSFFQALGRYFLSLVPWLFMIYILFYQTYHKLSFYDALVGNTTNLILGLATVAWIQIHIITKRKITTHDLICGTTVVKGKLAGKFPKFRF